MLKSTVLALVLPLVLIPAIGQAASPIAANVVLGQSDFVHNGWYGTEADSFSNPSALIVDAAGHLYVVDSFNNRVLGWLNAKSFTNGAPADLVLGQPDFTSAACNNGVAPGDVHGLGADSLCTSLPTETFVAASGLSGAAVDSNNNLYVADASNNRVLVYAAPFAACGSFPCVGPPAYAVFGQPDFISAQCNQGVFSPTARTLCGPTGITLDDKNNLFVSDPGNYRVLEYNTPFDSGSGEPGAGDKIADDEFGNSSFVERGSCDSSVFCGPAGIAVDQSGNLYVSDQRNGVVWVFYDPLGPYDPMTGAGDYLPDLYFGDPAVACNSAGGLCGPLAVTVDSVGNVYIADSGRVLEYNTPLDPSSGEPGAGDLIADNVIGAPDFTHSGCQIYGPNDSLLRYTSANAVCSPVGVALDSAGNLYLADSGANRVLAYNTPLNPSSGEAGAGDAIPDRILGQTDCVHKETNQLDASGLEFPESAVIDSVGHLYVSDSMRVLGWESVQALANGQPADLVLGQPDFISLACDQLSVLCDPTGLTIYNSGDLYLGLAVDSSNNLYAAATITNQVFEFNAPFASCASFPCVVGRPNLIIGDPDPDFSSCNATQKPTATGFCYPSALAFDSQNNLYVADADNNRVLEFDRVALKAGRKRILPHRVFGQRNFRSKECDDARPYSVCDPTAIAIDRNDNLYVNDDGGSFDQAHVRILEFFSPLKRTRVRGSGDHNVDVVIGEPDLKTLTNTCYDGPAPKASNFCDVHAIVVDTNGNLYATDLQNNRVLEFDAPLRTGESASRVFGQPDFTSGSCNDGSLPSDIVGLGPDSLCLSTPVDGGDGLALDANLDLLVTDAGNSRVLIFDNPLAISSFVRTPTNQK